VHGRVRAGSGLTGRRETTLSGSIEALALDDERRLRIARPRSSRHAIPEHFMPWVASVLRAAPVNPVSDRHFLAASEAYCVLCLFLRKYLISAPSRSPCCADVRSADAAPNEITLRRCGNARPPGKKSITGGPSTGNASRKFQLSFLRCPTGPRGFPSATASSRFPSLAVLHRHRDPIERRSDGDGLRGTSSF